LISKRPQHVGHLGLLDAETPNFAAPVAWKQKRRNVNITQIGQSHSGCGLLLLDGDMSQYISDNTDDEIGHHRFLNTTGRPRAQSLST